MFVLHSPLFTILKDVSFNRLITSVGAERDFFCSKWVLGKGCIIYCGTPWAFHITMF